MSWLLAHGMGMNFTGIFNVERISRAKLCDGSGGSLLWTGLGQVRFFPKVVLQNGLIPLQSEISLLAPNIE